MECFEFWEKMRSLKSTKNLLAGVKNLLAGRPHTLQIHATLSQAYLGY